MKVFDYNRVKDPEYFSDGRLDAHSDHAYYPLAQDVETGETSFRFSLNGLWKFHYARNYAGTIPGFEQMDYCCKPWDSIRVPANIQMEGYDIPQYVNVQYPWDGREMVNPGEIPQKFNPVASYVKYFEVPEQMKGRPVCISFQGAESGLAVWLNGSFIGYSEDSFTPSEFELTPYLQEGENKLAVQVFKWTSSSWCEDQDFYRFSGIYRDVYLYTVPDVHLYDLKVQTLLDEEYSSAILDIHAKWMLEGNCSTAETDPAGTATFTLSKDGNIIFKKEEPERNHYTFSVEQPCLWSAEQPVLYDLLLEIRDKDGKLQEVIPQKIGFRRFEMKDGMMQLNGKRIVFKGVNRHEFSSRTGRCVSYQELEQDIITMKQNNINAIRTCHYPDDSKIYGLCDQYGLYMIAEANLESHGSWDPSVTAHKDFSRVLPYDRPEWLPMMLDRVNSMYQRDKNHPAILIWSCGNESYGGKDIFEMSQMFRRLDSTRLVHYEGVFHDRRYPGTSDMESQMYSSAKAIQEFLAKDRSKPFICCEYAHAMGNSCGAMYKYTDLTDTEPLYQGGFIWDYIDQSIAKKDRYGKEFQAYGGDFGERPTDYNFSGNGIVYGGDRAPSPKMQEVKFNYQNITAEVAENRVTIKNKNLFTNTSAFDCSVVLEKDGKRVCQAFMETDVEPLSEKAYDLPFDLPKSAGEYAITVSFLLKKDQTWAKRGYEMAFGQAVHQVEAKKARACSDSFELIKGELNIGVRGSDFEVLFSQLNGGLVSYRYGGVEMIEAIPKPNFWRAPTDNDMGNLMPMRYAQWKIASMYLSHKDPWADKAYAPVLEEYEDCISVTYTYVLPTVPVTECQMTYFVYGDGTIRTRLSYDPIKELKDMPEFGVIFKLNADYDQVEWYGMGPDETYRDRCKGAKLGIYQNQVSDNMARYLVPQECGNKTGVRWAKVTDKKGRGMLWKGTGMEFSALPYTPHELENAAHAYELPPIHYTVVRVSKQQMGVAGDDSWGSRTHEEYLLDVSQKIEFEFDFKGI